MKLMGLSESDLDQPMYGVTETARLVGLSPNRVRRWLKGYEYDYGSERRSQGPVVRQSVCAESEYASFLDLIDLLFVKQFLDTGLSLQRLRTALDEASQILGTNHFARNKFFTDGRNIYLEIKRLGEEVEKKSILQLLSKGQWVIPEVIVLLAEQVDFDHKSELARRWYPPGMDGLIVLDPLQSFGRPSIVGRGIATANVFDFFQAEDSRIRPTCRWFKISQNEANAAVSFEQQLAA